ncbi:MAG: CRISPR-associated helicase Cas3' [Clostridiales bacterium]|jgi:CRISPR-associated endonuclease/helicase Cas3|nr:CRISPR-associated helicase Cas3' [Clostridiales bacterium]
MSATTGFLAHTRDDGVTQPLLEHLLGTAETARKNAGEWGGDFAFCCGLAHDVGKYSEKFQRRIRNENIRVDHATAGGQALYALNKESALSVLAAYCVTGHHGGLPNGGSRKQALGDKSDTTLFGRLKRAIEDYQPYKNEVGLPLLEIPNVLKIRRDGFDAAFFVRMLFSALVDADRLDTEKFCNRGNAPRGGFLKIPALLKALSVTVEKFLNSEEKPAESEITARNETLKKVRNALLRDCLSRAQSPPGLFKLTAPTGSGKTISSLAFALTHANENNLRRILYVVPYNTIIEQNAKVFEDILGPENVLRHNSDAEYKDDSEETQNKKFSVENWDFPVIVTSSVQFFESLFSNNTSKCRKLHNIAGSVLVFDEAQMIPVPYLLPCVHAIETLVTQYGCSAVLSTATQSAVDCYFKNIQPVEISQNPEESYAVLRRATIRPLGEALSDEDLSGRLLESESALCIVNTRAHAQELFKKLCSLSPEGAFHLSTTMYPEHRKRVLHEIRERLAENLVCRVISTSLVEAGVDLDFETVYREAAGLDSIVQAAGRCNREGKRSAGDSAVFVFSPAERKPPTMLRSQIDAYHQTADKHADLAGLETIEAYFEQLFYNYGEGNLDARQILRMFNDGAKSMSFPFEDAAKAFKLIDDHSQKTLYYLRENPALAERVYKGERSRELFREIGAYGINLYEYEVEKLRAAGAVDDRLDESIILLTGEYDSEMGVKLSPEGGQAFYV